MTAGRPRKPEHIKRAQGTLQPCRVVDDHVTFAPLSKLPDIPVTVPEQGKDYFTHCCQVLMSLNLLSAPIIPDIERAACWYHIYCDARDHIKEEGYVIEMANGNKTVSAYFSVLRDAQKCLVEFETRNGLNLIGSEKITSAKKTTKDEIFD